MNVNANYVPTKKRALKSHQSQSRPPGRLLWLLPHQRVVWQEDCVVFRWSNHSLWHSIHSVLHRRTAAQAPQSEQISKTLGLVCLAFEWKQTVLAVWMHRSTSDREDDCLMLQKSAWDCCEEGCERRMKTWWLLKLIGVDSKLAVNDFLMCEWHFRLLMIEYIMTVKQSNSKRRYYRSIDGWIDRSSNVEKEKTGGGRNVSYWY